MLKKALLALAVLVIGFVAVVAMQPSTYHVERTAMIDAKADAVWTTVADFKKWREWDPWQGSDPTQKTEISGEWGEVGHTSKWKGEKTGEGTMTISAADMFKRVDIKLEFRVPMESTADTAIILVEKGDATEVTWTMDGNADFMGKLFGLLMGIEDQIGSDYERGLKNLNGAAQKTAKELAELEETVAAEAEAMAAEAEAQAAGDGDAAPEE
jgi:hypothetical protein